MKKPLLYLTLLLFPFFAHAQAEAPVMEDFVKKARDFKSFILYATTNIVMADLGNTDTEISAVNSNLTVSWRTHLEGYGLAHGLFKGKIYVITASDHSAMNGPNNVYDAFLLDPASGKVVAKKEVYRGEGNFVEEPMFFAPKDGSFLKMVLRQTGVTRRLHVGLPGPLALIAIYSLDKQARETKGITITELDEKLDPVNVAKPALNDGTFFSASVNKKGSVFLSWAKGSGKIEAERYDPGKSTPSATITVPFDLRNNSEATHPENHFKVLSSEVNPDILYYAIAHEDKEAVTQLSVAKVNFADNTQEVTNEKLDREALKTMEKAYVVVNKKVDKPSVGYRKNIDINFMGEEAGNLVVGMVAESQNYNALSGNMYVSTGSPIISIYDLNMKLKARQLIPSTTTMPYMLVTAPPAVYFLISGRLYFIANDKTGGNTFTALYGIINLANGQYLKQDYLSKKHIKDSSFASKGVMWFSTAFIVPYPELSSMFQFLTQKMDYNLQLNHY